MILDSCVHLDLLITRECSSVTMDGALLAKCARVMIVTLRGDDYAYCKGVSNERSLAQFYTHGSSPAHCEVAPI